MSGNAINFGLGFDLTPLQQGANAAKKLVGNTMGSMHRTAAAGAGRVGGAFKSLAAPLLAVLPAIAASFTGRAIAAGVKGVFDYGRALQVTSRQSGVSVRDLALLKAQFKASGADAEGVAPALAKVQKALAGVDEEGSGAPKALAALGLNLVALKDAAPGAQLLAVGQAIANIADPAKRTAAAMAIFGRAGAELNAVFTQDFGRFTAGQLAKADALARNAASFERASVLLQKSGNVLKTFYVGTAEGVVNGLIPLLDALNKVDLVAQGRQFGEALSKTAQIFAGSFKVPDAFLAALADGMVLAGLGLGNALIASFKVGIDFLQTGMAAALASIGDMLMGTLLNSFAKPVAFFQASLEQAVEYGTSPVANAQRAVDASQADVDQLQARREQVRPGSGNTSALGKLLGTKGDMESPARFAALGKELATAQARLGTQKARFNAAMKDADKSLFDSVEDRYTRIMAEGGPRAGFTGGGNTSAELLARGRDGMKEAATAAVSAFKSFKVEDLLGAGEVGARLAANGKRLQEAGAAALGTTATGPAAAGQTAADAGRAVANKVSPTLASMETTRGLVIRTGLGNLIGNGALNGPATALGGGASRIRDYDRGRTGLTTGGLATGGLATGSLSGGGWGSLAGAEAQRKEQADRAGKEKEVAKAENPLLRKIEENTDAMVKIWRP